MGVPHLFGSWLRLDKYASVLSSFIQNNISSLSLDMNSIIHLACSIVFLYGDFEDEAGRIEIAAAMKSEPEIVYLKVYQVVMDIIVEISTYIRPRDVLILAVDGVVPMGKIQQSSSRRYRNGLSISSNTLFDTTSISPGTLFMRNLDTYITKQISVRYQQLSARKVFYSSHEVPGEGEHKIFDYYRKGTINDPKNKDGYHVIYGMDADLIVLSLLSDVENIILAKDSIPLNVMRLDGKSVSAQQKRGGDNRNVYINDLRLALREEMGKPSAVIDFCLMVSLVGNDFLPHPPSASSLKETIEIMMKLYHNVTGPMVQMSPGGSSHPGFGKYSYTVNWQHLYELLFYMRAEEPAIMNNVAAREIKHPFKAVELSRIDKNTVDYAVFRQYWYVFALVPRSARGDDIIFTKIAENTSSSLGYKLEMKLDPKDINSMCLQYLTGLNWILQYYTRGSDSVTWKWYYPFYHSPLIYDIATYLEENMNLGENIYSSILPAQGEVRFSYLHQMLATIPPQSMNLVPDQIKYLYEITSPIIDLMPISFDVEKDGASVDWVSVCLKPFMDYDRIIGVVPQIIIPTPGKDKLVHVSEEKYAYMASMKSGVSFPRGRGGRGGSERGRGRGQGEQTTRGRSGSERGRGRGQGEQTGRGRGGSERGRGRGEQTGRGRGRDGVQSQLSKSEWSSNILMS